MHTMWRGSVSFGLVNVPVRMYKATESQSVHFRQLHKTCKSPIAYQKRCPICQVDVEPADIVKGFEYAKGQYVVVDEEELAALDKTRSQTIDIVQFTNAAEIDPIYFDASYYLAPEASGRKAYALLVAALRDTSKVAIARMVLRATETMACIRVVDETLVAHSLVWPQDIRSRAELPYAGDPVPVAEDELKVAVQLIDQLAKPFDPTQFVDERRAAIEQLVEQKRAHADAVIQTPATAPASADVISLMEALQKSIKMAQKSGAEPKRKKRKSS
ncbi:DNA end-binding protein Ku [Alicyclobacillus sacchari]|uniref:Non-homologous end joining protein Ku n=1 Tax=Alicyclobacillus sacchari TaxID=392010 RepID=A0A4R8LT67_9BACL|nr:Ku protein [Alicyclobacillus sacchari]TDY50698.1 DNA end-binding protein Ku [Alicyclobacillus sacchari]GMA55678.1 non-homologous end joining protein Ku [Alicyclobacillus sacchari]